MFNERLRPITPKPIMPICILHLLHWGVLHSKRSGKSAAGRFGLADCAALAVCIVNSQINMVFLLIVN